MSCGRRQGGANFWLAVFAAAPKSVQEEEPMDVEREKAIRNISVLAVGLALCEVEFEPLFVGVC